MLTFFNILLKRNFYRGFFPAQFQCFGIVIIIIFFVVIQSPSMAYNQCGRQEVTVRPSTPEIALWKKRAVEIIYINMYLQDTPVCLGFASIPDSNASQ